DIDDNLIFVQREIDAPDKPDAWAVSTKKQALPPELRNVLEETESVAFLVIKDDTIRAEEYWDKYGPDSKSNSFSMAKSIVSTLIGIAIKDGYIKSIEQPVANFLPEFKEGDKKFITIKHLLMMSSGLNWDESYGNPLSVTTEGYYGDNLKKAISKLEAVEKPGQEFSYKSGDTQVLAFVLEAATGKKLSDFASERFWKRVGAAHDAEWSIDHENGDEKAFCCFFSNARDFARLGKLYLQNGVWNGDTLLPASYVKAATTPHGLPYGSGKQSDFYGYQWWIIPEFNGHKVFYARGILGQYMVAVPDKNLIIVRLGKNKKEKVNNHYKDMLEITEQVLKNY
ncbi:MAG: class C beta-lactamase-related serine hydrolase, partial [Chitinophagaceae bacterium]